MGVDHAAYCGKGSIEQQMGRQIGGGTERAFNNLSVQIRQHQIGGFKSSYGTPLGLIATRSALPIDAAGIAECVQDQSSTNQFEVGLQHS